MWRRILNCILIHRKMSLADALLADLDGLSDDEARSPSPGPEASSSMPPPGLPNQGKRPASAMEVDDGEGSGNEDERDDMKLEDGTDAVGFVPEGGVRPADELDKEEVEKTDMKGVEDVKKVAKLAGSQKLQDVLAVRAFTLVVRVLAKW